MENTVNLTSYQNVESLQLNLPEDEFRQYCELKLLSAKDDVDFIKKHIYQGKQMSVCELGCGNGKLLLALEREGMVSNAVGYEVSGSRCKFANKFLSTYDSKKVQILNQNFLDDGEAERGYDLIILVDIFLNIISPLYDNTEYETVQWIYRNLARGGGSTV